MLMTLEKLDRKSLMDTGKFIATSVTINTSYIISVKPAPSRWGRINEINDEPVSGVHATEIVYTTGGSTETIIVLGKYENIVRRAEGRRVLRG